VSCPLRDLWIIVDQSAYKAVPMTIYRNVRIAEQQTTIVMMTLLGYALSHNVFNALEVL